MRELLQSLPAAVAYVVGPDLVFELINEEFRRTAGGRELIGRPLQEALPELSPERLAAIRRAARGGQPVGGRASEAWLRRDGTAPEQFFADYIYQPVRDATGGVAGLLLYGSDVTTHVRDRLRLEEVAGDLAETEGRYRTLFETLPAGLVYVNADESVLAANPAAGEILGLAPEQMSTWPFGTLRRAVHEDGSGCQPHELPVAVALRTGKIVASQVLGVPHGRTGEVRWLRVTAIPDSRDERGQPLRVYAMIADVTEQHRAEAALREGNRLLGRLREANVIGVVESSEKGIHEANDAFLDIIGYTRDDLESGRLHWRAITAPEWAASDSDALEQVRRTGVYRPFEKEYLHRDGHRVVVLVAGAAIDWHPLRWGTFVVDLTARQRAEQERTALLASEHAARAEAEVAREKLAFLLRAGDLLAAGSDPDDLLGQVTRLVVPVLADYCVAFLPTPDGMLRATALTDRDLERGEVLKRLQENPIPAAGPAIAQKAYTTGTTHIAREYSDRAHRLSDLVPGLNSVAENVRPTSALAVPLLARQHPHGVLVLGRGEPRPRFTGTDVAVVEVLARRLAAGLANAETFVREHTVAETLQQALLPAALPEIEGLDLAVHYLPASDGVHVGGDWYDVFPLADGRIGLTIGDVAGHSIESASIMGQIRGLLRGYAIDAGSPRDVLRRVDTAMCQLLPEAVATAFYAVLNPATGDLAYANAGHPPPLYTSGHGQAGFLDDSPGIMLGTGVESSSADGCHRLSPGAGLLLYTDGLIERRQRDIYAGCSALLTAFRQSRGQTAEQMCRSAQEALLDSAPRADDVCILSVRRLSRHLS